MTSLVGMTTSRGMAAMAAAALFVLTSCGGGDGSSGGGSSGDQLTLDQVAKVACDGKPYKMLKRGELEIFTDNGAECGRTTVFLFDSPGQIKNWTEVAQSNGRIVVGVNWAVEPGDDATSQRLQDELDGKELGGF